MNEIQSPSAHPIVVLHLVLAAALCGCAHVRSVSIHEEETPECRPSSFLGYYTTTWMPAEYFGPVKESPCMVNCACTGGACVCDATDGLVESPQSFASPKPTPSPRPTSKTVSTNAKPIEAKTVEAKTVADKTDMGLKGSQDPDPTDFEMIEAAPTEPQYGLEEYWNGTSVDPVFQEVNIDWDQALSPKQAKTR